MATASLSKGAFPWPTLSSGSNKEKKPQAKGPTASKKRNLAHKSTENSSTQDKSSSLAKTEEFEEKIVQFYDQRCMKLWMIVMISLGHLPYANHRGRLKEADKDFLRNYNKRVRFLKGRTTTTPQNGLALCLPYHPATEGDKKSERYYDVVSALNVLRSNGYDTPSTVETMIGYLEQIPLPPHSHDAVPKDEKGKRDNSARIITGMNKTMQLLLVEMIRLHYKQPLTAQTMGDILQLMVKDLASGIGRDGIKTQLELALGTFESGT